MSSGIPLSSGFNVNAGIPLELKKKKATLQERDAIPLIQRYLGLEVFVEADGQFYYLEGGHTNNDWKTRNTVWDKVTGGIRYDQNVGIGKDPSVELDVLGDVSIEGSLNITGNIYQNGSIYNTHAQQLYTTKDLIITRSEAGVGQAITAGTVSGIKVTKYDGTNDLVFGTDAQGFFRVGELGSLQVLSTRENSPNALGIPYYNASMFRWDTTSNMVYNTTTNRMELNALKVGSSSGMLKVSSGVLTLAVAGTDYLTSFAETDPTVPTYVKSITTTNISNWDAAHAHITSTGTDHSYINQEVTTSSIPTFVGIQGYNTAWNMMFSNASYIYMRDGANTSTIRFYPDSGNVWAAGTLTATGGNSTEWNTAYTDRLKWNGGSTGLNATTGRASLGLGTAATHDAQISSTDTTAGRLMEVGAFGLGRESGAVLDLTTAISQLGVSSANNANRIVLSRASSRASYIEINTDSSTGLTISAEHYNPATGTSFTGKKTIYHTGNLVNPVTGTGTAGQVSYWDGTGSQAGSAKFTWDDTNSRLIVNSSTAGYWVLNNPDAYIALRTGSDTSTSGANISTNTSGDLMLVTRTTFNAERMRIMGSTGNVLIGKTSVTSGYMLDVNGAIRAAGNIYAAGKITAGAQVPVALSPASTVTWNVGNNYNARITLNQNITLSLTGASAGDSGVLTVIQDSTGYRNITLPSGHLFEGGGQPSLSSLGGQKDLLAWYYDGTNYFWTLGKKFS